jgi:hypothetical protein
MAVEERTVDKETVWNNKNRLKFATTPLWKTLSLPPEVPYEGHLRLSADAEQRRIVGSGALVPIHEDLPEFNVGVDTSPHGGSPTYKMSVGLPSDRLRATQEWNFGDMPTTTSTLESNLGPASLYYKTQEQPGSPGDMKSQGFGGELKLGPVTFFGERTNTGWEGRHPWSGKLFRDPLHAKHMGHTRYDRRTQEAGAKVKAPVGSGIAGLKAARRYMRTLFPHGKGESRPMQQAPNITSVEGGWEGRVGSGTLGISGGADFTRGIGTSPYAKGSYAMEDPLGLGGTLTATGTWANPLGKSSGLETWLEWTKKF